MPTNLVKTESDERLWRQAKALAAKNGHKENWGYIVSIYQTIKGRDAAKQAALYCLALNPEYVSGSLALRHMEKQAGFWTAPRLGFLEKVVRSLPVFMRPSVQKMIVSIKYPELYAIISAKGHRRRLEANKMRGLLRAITNENQSLARDLAHSRAEGVWNLLSGPNAPRGTDPNWKLLFGI